MLIICEDCAKRYKIDESRIKSNRARFSCKECGHIIIVEKTDLSRPLISKSSASQSLTGTIDLLREMEDAPAPGLLGDTASENEIKKLESDVLAAKKSAPVAVYFGLAFLAALIGTGGVLAFLYLTDIAPLIRQSETRSDFLVTALSLLGGVWFVILGIYYLLARALARPIIQLKEDLIRLVRGEEDGVVSICGPRELKELANILSRITGNRQ